MVKVKSKARKGGSAVSGKQLLCSKQTIAVADRVATVGAGGDKGQRALNEFDRQHAALVARNTKKKFQQVTITLQGSILAGVATSKPVILPDILLAGEIDEIPHRAESAAVERLNSNTQRVNMFSALDEDEPAAAPLTVKPSALFGLLSTKASFQKT